mgnify:CR=1 FL=1
MEEVEDGHDSEVETDRPLHLVHLPSEGRDGRNDQLRADLREAGQEESGDEVETEEERHGRKGKGRCLPPFFFSVFF